jgi:citrate lyase subunit beta / citryl-CoA lyase
VRLARSVLFTPGTRGDRVEKALRARAADIVVADLEDGVAPDEKDAARQTVGRVLAANAGEDTPVRAVRVNTLASGMAMLDLAAVMHARPRLIVVPKAERVADVAALDVALARF